MTALVDESTREALRAGDVDSLTTSFGLVVIVLLLLLLIERELLRSYDRATFARAGRLQFVIVPLLVVAAVIVGARFANLAGA
jgi:hypothetical protein